MTKINGTLDQIAYVARSDRDVIEIKRSLGLDNAEWVEDYVVATGQVHGEETTNIGHLLFNYDTGIEIEILRYLEGDNYADGVLHDNGLQIGRVPSKRVCHIGIHANADGPAPTFNYPIVQEVWTDSHTNPYLLERGRKYHYTIFDSFAALGHYLKVIERIEKVG